MIIKLIRKPVKIAGFFPWHRARNWLEWTTGSVVSYKNWCHIINYLLLLPLLRTVLGNVGPQSFLYGPRCARSVLPQPWANIPQYGPHVQLVRGYYSWVCLIGTSMLWVNLPRVGTIYSQSNKFVMGVKIKATGDNSKLNDSPATPQFGNEPTSRWQSREQVPFDDNLFPEKRLSPLFSAFGQLAIQIWILEVSITLSEIFKELYLINYLTWRPVYCYFEKTENSQLGKKSRLFENIYQDKLRACF